jgi:hypothetical protein
MLPDSGRRATRTLLQTSTVAAVVVLLSVFDIIHWTDIQTAAVMAVATPLVSWMQNLLEDRAVIPALLRAPEVPVVEATT